MKNLCWIWKIASRIIKVSKVSYLKKKKEKDRNHKTQLNFIIETPSQWQTWMNSNKIKIKRAHPLYQMKGLKKKGQIAGRKQSQKDRAKMGLNTMKKKVDQNIQRIFPNNWKNQTKVS